MKAQSIGYLALAASAGTLLASCKVISDVKEISENVNSSTENILETSLNAYKTAKLTATAAAIGGALCLWFLIRRKR